MSADRKKILVVDDEISITRLLKLNLERTGKYIVYALNTPEAALKTALEFHPDLFLLDVFMPGLDGGYLASALRSHPALSTVPIVFLTAGVTKPEVLAHNGIIGGSRFLAKPVNLAEVLECLEEELSCSASSLSDHPVSPPGESAV